VGSIATLGAAVVIAMAVVPLVILVVDDWLEM
jgi:hypothetical protein